MSDVLIVKNVPREGPGLLEQVLRDENISFDLIDLDQGDKFPSPTDYKALVVLGGPNSANDATEKMTNELARVRIALEHGIPCLGICLGLQVLVKAAGGKVVPSEHKEVGLIEPSGGQYTVELTAAGRADPLFARLPEVLEVFQLHGEAVELTDSMQLLARGRYCKNQVVKVTDKVYGIQSHFELTPEMLAVWAEQDPDLIPLGKDKLLESFEAIQPGYTQTGETLLRNFLQIAGLQ